jgi:hypothetical protein
VLVRFNIFPVKLVLASSSPPSYLHTLSSHG